MSAPTYEELLVQHGLEKSIMRQTLSDEHLRQFSLSLDTWEKLARFLRMTSPDITNIKNQGDVDEQKIRMLETWKQRHGSKATYEAMVKALLQISRIDLAEKVITLTQSLKDITTLETATTDQPLSRPKEPNMTVPTSPVSSSGIEDESSSAAMSPLSPPATPSEHTVILTLKELEKEFYDLVIFIEDTLENRRVSLNKITIGDFVCYLNWFKGNIKQMKTTEK